MAIKYALDLSAKEARYPCQRQWHEQSLRGGKRFLDGRTQEHYDMSISRSWTHLWDHMSEET